MPELSKRRGRVSARSIPAFAALCAFATVTVVAPHRVYADGAADEADLHFQLGAERYQAGDFRGALVEFFASNRLVPNRNVVFNIARTYEQMRQFDEAYRYYIDAADGETNADTRREVEAAAHRIEPNVAILQVETDPPGATIFLNREDLGSRGRTPRPLALEAGAYTVILARPGYETVTMPNVTLRVGQRTRITTPMRLIVGEVHVNGTAGASVRIDDERAEAQCTVPCDAVVPPGTHILYITADGYTTQPRPVSVAARERTEITATLSPVTGAIIVGADEQGALVEVDGHAVGFTPTVVQGVPVGRHRVRVSGSGFSAVEREVTVEANRQADLQNIELIPVREVTAASRTTESVEDAPSSVTIIDGREIRAFGYPTIAEALRGVRDVYVSFDGVYASAGIRGIGQPNDYGNRLLVLSDGATLNDNVLGSSYIGYDGRADLEDVERIEVVRGPGSVLYGTGALSGVVNLVMRGRESPQGISGGISTYEDAVARARVRGHVNFGRDGGAWISASGALSRGHSFDLANSHDAAGETLHVDGIDSFQAGTVSGRAWYGALNAQWMLTSRQIDIPHGAYGTIPLDGRTRYTDTRGMAEVRFEPRLSNNAQVLARAYANFYTFAGTNSYQPAPTHAEVENYQGVWAGAETRLVITPKNWLRLTGGIEFQYHPIIQLVGERPDQTDPEARFYLDRRSGNQTENHPLIVGAAYALAEANPARWIRASLGVRLDVFDYMNTALQSGGTFQTSEFALFTSVNPRAAVILKPVSGLVVKLMAGRAFRAPSVYEFFYRDGSGNQVRSDVGGRTLGPEQVWSGEAEVSYRFLNDWVGLVSGYAAQIDGIIQTVNVDVNGMPSTQYQNTGTAVAYGVDAEIRREWRQGWMLSAMGGYLQENLVGVSGGSLAYDSTVVNVPHFLTSVRAVAPIIRGLVNLGSRVTLEAPRRISYSVASNAPGGSTAPAVIADMTISGTAPRLGIHYVVGVYNLFDYRWAVPVSGSFYQNTQPQLGRTFMVSLSTSF